MPPTLPHASIHLGNRLKIQVYALIAFTVVATYSACVAYHMDPTEATEAAVWNVAAVAGLGGMITLLLTVHRTLNQWIS